MLISLIRSGQRASTTRARAMQRQQAAADRVHRCGSPQSGILFYRRACVCENSARVLKNIWGVLRAKPKSQNTRQGGTTHVIGDIGAPSS